MPEAAIGILEIITNNMLQAIRFVTVERGYDPRDFALVGFGGCGPMFVAELARHLEMGKAVVPFSPGVFSAWGLLQTDLFHDASKTMLKLRSSISLEELEAIFDQLRDRVLQSFLREGVPMDDVVLEHYLDLQYYGQVYSLAVSLSDLTSKVAAERQSDIRVMEEGIISVPLPLGKATRFRLSQEILDAAIEVFHREHLREYGHADPDMEVQIVHARVFGRAEMRKPQMAGIPSGRDGRGADAAVKGERDVLFGSRQVATRIFDRSLLAAGSRLQGPAIIEEPYSTTIIPPDMRAEIDVYGNIVIETR